MRLVYVAGPYRAPSGWERARNVSRAARWARAVWAGGAAAICPHLNTLEMDGPGLTTEAILTGDLEIVGRCDEIHVLPGWERSEGTLREVEHARSRPVPIRYVREEEIP